MEGSGLRGVPGLFRSTIRSGCPRQVQVTAALCSVSVLRGVGTRSAGPRCVCDSLRSSPSEGRGFAGTCPGLSGATLKYLMAAAAASQRPGNERCSQILA